MAAFCWLAALATKPEEDFAASRAVDADKASVLVRSLSDGSVLASLNEGKPLVPASIKKVTTIASLLDKTGVEYKYHTSVYLEGKRGDNVLDGNIVVIGRGDPTVNSRVEPKSADLCAEIVDALRREGIDSISGSIIIDGNLFEGPACPPSWASGDLSNSYGTGSHAFNFENNASGKAAVKNPSAVFISRLKGALAKAGIKTGGSGDRKNRRKLLVDHRSAPVDEIMRSCMMRSDNLFAEAMLKTLALETQGVGSTERGTVAERKHWEKKKMPLDGVTLVDGSGLSRSNRVTASFMSDVLAEMADNVYFASFFPLAGQEGTLRKFLAGTSLDSYIAMKTGSMNGIQCYAGYLLDDNYVPTHTVVVMLNGLPQGRAAARAEVEKMLLRLFDAGYAARYDAEHPDKPAQAEEPTENTENNE